MDVFKDIFGLSTRRFLLNALLPSSCFWCLLGLVVLSNRFGVLPGLLVWDALPSPVKYSVAAAVALLIFACAGLTAAGTMNILKLYEGYWPWPLERTVGATATRWHRERLATLAATHAIEAIYFGYPPSSRPEAVMPTRLGNILKGSEMYASMRYGLDSVLIWPRLYPLLPEGTALAISDLRGLLEFHLAVSFSAMLFAVVSGAYLLVTADDWRLFLLCVWGGATTSWIAYRSSLPSAMAYAEQVRSAFDGYRNQLLTQFRIELPATPDEERAIWREVCIFILRNVREHPEGWQYTKETRPDHE